MRIPSWRVSGTSSSRLACRLPDSRRESVLVDMPARVGEVLQGPVACRARCPQSGAHLLELVDHDVHSLPFLQDLFAILTVVPRSMVDMDETWDVIVVGGSAAGLSAALMLGRARRRVLVVDAGEPRNRFAAHMHGVLGHEGVDPAELLRLGRDEVGQYGVEVRPGSSPTSTKPTTGCRCDWSPGSRTGAAR